MSFLTSIPTPPPLDDARALPKNVYPFIKIPVFVVRRVSVKRNICGLNSSSISEMLHRLPFIPRTFEYNMVHFSESTYFFVTVGHVMDCSSFAQEVESICEQSSSWSIFEALWSLAMISYVLLAVRRAIVAIASLLRFDGE